MNGLIIIIYGLPGTGKTTICKLLLERFASNYIGVDQVWPMLFSNPTYSAPESNAVFQEILNMIERLLPNNTVIFVEGVFASSSRFRPLENIGEKYDRRIYKIALTCDEETAIRRVANRPANNNAGKNITPESWLALARKIDSLTTADLVIDTSILSKERATDSIAATINSLLIP